MNSKVLVTGGAGFIGSFLVDRLVLLGYSVRVLDNLIFQVHNGKYPIYLNKNVEYVYGDVRDKSIVAKCLVDVKYVFHLASQVGVQQSNSEIQSYVDINLTGFANLLDSIHKNKFKIKKIILTSSMTSYGEGDYFCQQCGIVKPELRKTSQLIPKKWELRCPRCLKDVEPVPTRESSPLNANSIYALTKKTQEEMLFLFGNIYNIPVISFRLFNVYGPRQSLLNPYTGVIAIFANSILNNFQPVVYEDGLQTRDFIYVEDVVRALYTTLDTKLIDNMILNIGSGEKTSILKIANMLSGLYNADCYPQILQKYRVNDIRHCYADISKIKKQLHWKPTTKLEDGMQQTCEYYRSIISL